MSSASPAATVKIFKQPTSNQNGITGAAATNDSGGHQVLLTTYKRVADIVPGPDYSTISDLAEFERCIRMLELYELPVEMMNDASPFKTYDVVKRINNVRRAVKDAGLAKRCRNLLVKWKNAIHELQPASVKLTASESVQIPRTTAVSSPAAVGPVTGVSSPSMANGLDKIYHAVITPVVPAEQQRIVPALKIKIKALDPSAVRNGEVLPKQEPLDSYYIIQSQKRPADEAESEKVIMGKLDDITASTSETIVTLEQPPEKKRKSVRIKPVRKLRIDLSDDESEYNMDDHVLKAAELPASDTVSLKQKLISMLESLPVLRGDEQHAFTDSFAEFFAEEEKRADIYREQQLQLAADQKAAADALFTDRVTTSGDDDQLRSLLSSPYGQAAELPAGATCNAVIDDGDDDDDFSFGPSVGELTVPSIAQTLAKHGTWVASRQHLHSFNQTSSYTSAAVDGSKPNTIIPADFSVPTSTEGVPKLHDDSTVNKPLTESVATQWRTVDIQFLTQLHTRNFPNGNGHYDADSVWHNVTDAYVTRRSDGKNIVVAPYAVLD